VADAECLHLPPCLLGPLAVPQPDDGDLERDTASQGLADIGQRAGMGATATGDAIVLIGIVAVIAGGERDVGILEQVPQPVRNSEQIGEHLRPQTLCQRASQQSLEVRVLGRLTTDELDGVDPGSRGRGDHGFPIFGRHGAVSDRRSGLGIAVGARQLAATGDLQLQETHRVELRRGLLEQGHSFHVA